VFGLAEYDVLYVAGLNNSRRDLLEVGVTTVTVTIVPEDVVEVNAREKERFARVQRYEVTLGRAVAFVAGQFGYHILTTTGGVTFGSVLEDVSSFDVGVNGFGYGVAGYDVFHNNSPIMNVDGSRRESARLFQFNDADFIIRLRIRNL
jgi:hypothetical protein